MVAFEYVLLFVRDISVSTQFYTKLLECEPLALSPTFVRFPLSPGAQLELWQSDRVDPRQRSRVGVWSSAWQWLMRMP